MIDLSAACTVPAEKTVVAAGLFDGLHIGHASVMDKTLSLCRHGISPAVFTFKTGSLDVKEQGILISDEKKIELLSKMGIKYIFSPSFSEIRDMTPERFVMEIIANRLNASCVVCGENFHFGKDGFADCNTLEKICNSIGIEVYVVPLVSYRGENVSSSRIRECLKSGRIEEANALLGRKYSIIGRVIGGNQIGRTLNFPTINQRIDKSFASLRRGVYASEVVIGRTGYLGVTNIGVKPTVSFCNEVLAETHIIGFTDDIYGENAEVRLNGFVRDEEKFETLDELKKQVAKDIDTVRGLYDRGGNKYENNTERKI